MKGDFARVTFNPAHHYTQVFQQQGRVLLEADWNEQGGIQLYLLHSLIRDLVGSCWAAGAGFAIGVQPDMTDWTLSPGHFYVDGILCENDAACTLETQPYLPLPNDGSGDWLHVPRQFALWLDVWERHLSAIEAPGIADTALLGVDTATRAQTVWQIRMLDLDAERLGASLGNTTTAIGLSGRGDADKKQALAELDSLRKSLPNLGAANRNDICTTLRQLLTTRARYAWPRLRATLGPVDSDSDPCVIAADARYRGCENQLYRVEVHQGGLAGTAEAPAAASFKWSRENGSVIFPITKAVNNPQADGTTQVVVTLAKLGRDQRLGLAVKDWVELVDDDYSLSQLAFPLLQVIAIDPADGLVTLAVSPGDTAYAVGGAAKHPLLRRWDQSEELDVHGCVPLIEGEAIDLEDGIQISFEAGGVYATGDYWMIPARVAGNGTLDWPKDGDRGAALKSFGMHHLAVLGTLWPQLGYTECCCRFDSLCTLLGQAANRRAVDAGVVVTPTTRVRKTAVAKTAPTSASKTPAAKTKRAPSKAVKKTAASRTRKTR